MTPSKVSEESSPSPMRKYGQLRLDAIEETDSFCTDSSFVASASLCHTKSITKGENRGLIPDAGDISEEDEDAEDSCAKPVLDALKLKGMESEAYGGDELNGSPIKRALRFPIFHINEIVAKAKNDAKLTVKVQFDKQKPVKPLIQLQKMSPLDKRSASTLAENTGGKPRKELGSTTLTKPTRRPSVLSEHQPSTSQSKSGLPTAAATPSLRNSLCPPYRQQTNPNLLQNVRRFAKNQAHNSQLPSGFPSSTVSSTYEYPINQKQILSLKAVKLNMSSDPKGKDGEVLELLRQVQV